MAEAIVSIATERIGDLLIREADFVSSVRGKVEQLQRTLKHMRCFLKDADGKQEQDERIQNFIAEIRDLTYDAEDAIDTFILKAPRRRDGFCGWIMDSVSIITKCYQFHKIGTEIDAIRAKLTEISTNMQTFGIIPEGEGSSSAGEMQRRLRRSYPHAEEDHVLVGLEDSEKDVIAQLMREDDQLRVVSIVGIGGLGKTTLAKKVYNHVNVNRHFDCCCWAFISQQFSVRDVLIGIIKEVDAKESREKLEKTREEDLVVTLHNTLKEKRYLLVLDDIWKNEAWDSLKAAIPTKGKNGCKVLFTTRIKEVALYADPRSSPVELPFLSDDDGWTLLRKIAIVGKDEQSISPEFDNLGKQMVKRCGGLPLAIVVLGGLLANKKSLNEWKAVHRNINAQLIKLQHQQQYNGVYWILALSYRELPFHLKPCFLYLSQFPEDYEIHKRDLIRMWIAEGFVSELLTDDMTLEDVGEAFLNELVSRCMVQVYKRDHTGRGVKTFRIHDLMRDMCLLKAKKEGFLQVADMTKRGESSTNKSRRIAVHCHHTVGDDDFLPSYHAIGDEGRLLPIVEGNPSCRSLIYFLGIYEMKRLQLESICENYRLVRVLKLDGIRLVCGFPEEVVGNDLIHLRYLGLRRFWQYWHESIVTHYSGNQLVISLSKMRSLLTLDVRHKPSHSIIPDVLWKLKCLRHLLVDRIDKIGRIDTLINLETLKDVNAKFLIANDAVQKLRNLRNLGVWFERSKDVETVLKSPIFRLGHLRCLKLQLDEYQRSLEFSNLEVLSHCDNLTKLELKGKISDNLHQHDLKFLPISLSKLVLWSSHLTKDPMPILEKLPNLRFLEFMYSAFEVSEMICSANGFPQLEVLRLGFIYKTEEWRVEEGAMPLLKTLVICDFRTLKKIPEGLKYVASLQQLKISDMPDEFYKRVEVQGEDYYKVCHIPDITFNDFEGNSGR